MYIQYPAYRIKKIINDLNANVPLLSNKNAAIAPIGTDNAVSKTNFDRILNS